MEEDLEKIERFILLSKKTFGEATELAFAWRRIKDRYRELEVITNGIKVLETNGVNDETFYVIAKTDFLRGSYKHLLDDYIPKSKIKEKIEELERTRKEISKKNNYTLLKDNPDTPIYDLYGYFLVVLQELMEDK